MARQVIHEGIGELREPHFVLQPVGLERDCSEMLLREDIHLLIFDVYTHGFAERLLSPEPVM